MRPFGVDLTSMSLPILGSPRMPSMALSVFVILGLLSAASGVYAQVTEADFRKLRINEIVANNDNHGPQNCRCRFVDMVEIYNGSDKTIPLTSSLGDVRLWDRSFLTVCIDPANPTTCTQIPNAYRLATSQVTELVAGQRMVVFCDNRPACDGGDRSGTCIADRASIPKDLEPHTDFGLSANGECLILTLDPPGAGEEIVLHEVTYPELRGDVVYARFPEDVDSDHWVFTRTGTFGTCHETRQGSVTKGPICVGLPNAPAAPIPPDIEQLDYSTNSPRPGEDVTFRVRILDDFSPVESNFNHVELRWCVDLVPQEPIPMTFLELVVEPDPDPDPVLGERCPSLREWSIWEVTIPGQVDGAVVRFSFHCQDIDNQDASDPNLGFCATGPQGPCDYDTGPCDFDSDPDNPGPGPNCTRFQDCNVPFRYTTSSGTDRNIVINEIVPNNDSIIEDTTEDLPCVPATNVNCRFDDFIELCNSSASLEELDGLLLMTRPFRPERAWEFRPNSDLLPLSHLIVWIDNDDEDPDPLADPPVTDPNPNDPAAGEHHTDFQVDADRDEVFLVHSKANGFRVISGVRWGVSGRYSHSTLQPLSRKAEDAVFEAIFRDESIVRIPDCDPLGAWMNAAQEEVTPGAPNEVSRTPLFIRGDYDASGERPDFTDALAVLTHLFLGTNDPPICQDAADADNNGAMEFNDALVILSFLFLGNVEIPTPGPDVCGPDPVEAIPAGMFLGLGLQPAAADESGTPFDGGTLDCASYPRPGLSCP